jgi:DNA polymerase, archaea type
VSRPAAGSTGRLAGLHLQHALFGCDETPGIVAVTADSNGRARIWQRVGERTESSEHGFANWFLVTSACLDMLSHLPAETLSADALRDAHGQLLPTAPLAVLELDGSAGDPDAYRYLVLTQRLHEIETTLVEMSNKRDGAEALTLADLRGLVLIWDPVEQFLTLTGRTYFKGMRFEDLRRFQFDLETTGLNEERDRIFMVSMRDSSGWNATLDTTDLDEQELIEQLVATITEHDPDVLENHNIFAFDLSFLVRRASRLGVPLTLGRDGSEPTLETDVFDSGERAEPFLRWRIAGREVIDTQHAVRRFGSGAPDMRRHGLKEAARYFGFARADREYVAGVDVWPTYRDDPERIRRYAAADVEEVDGLSRRLLPPAFSLASRLPRAYERIAADSSPASLWELLLVRAYLQEGWAIPAPMPRLQRPTLGPRTEMLWTGVFGTSVRAVMRSLLPCVVADNGVAAMNDDRRVMPLLVREALADEPARALDLASAAHAYLAGQGLFSDPGAASDAMAVARRYVDRLLSDVRARGCTVVEVDGEEVLFAVPDTWTDATESEVVQAARAYLPDSVELAFTQRFQALYARAPRSTIMLGADGAVTLVGATFRPGRFERFGEAFMHRAAACALAGDAVGLRREFLEMVHLLRTFAVPLEELCVQVTLHKSPPQYRRGGTHEEPYEVLLAAGVRAWRVGQRIRYFRVHGGEPRLLVEGDTTFGPADADAEYYVQRLVGMYCQQFAQAFLRADYLRIFRVPEGAGPYAVNDSEFADIRTIHLAASP